jgi:hypothetical protein
MPTRSTGAALLGVPARDIRARPQVAADTPAALTCAGSEPVRCHRSAAAAKSRGRGAFADTAARISTYGSNRSLGVQSKMSQSAAKVQDGIRWGSPVTSRYTCASDRWMPRERSSGRNSVDFQRLCDAITRRVRRGVRECPPGLTAVHRPEAASFRHTIVKTPDEWGRCWTTATSKLSTASSSC